MRKAPSRIIPSVTPLLFEAETSSKPQTNKGSKSHIARTNFRANRFGVDYGERLR